MPCTIVARGDRSDPKEDRRRRLSTPRELRWPSPLNVRERFQPTFQSRHRKTANNGQADSRVRSTLRTSAAGFLPGRRRRVAYGAPIPRRAGARTSDLRLAARLFRRLLPGARHGTRNLWFALISSLNYPSKSLVFRFAVRLGHSHDNYSLAAEGPARVGCEHGVKHKYIALMPGERDLFLIVNRADLIQISWVYLRAISVKNISRSV